MTKYNENRLIEDLHAFGEDPDDESAAAQFRGALQRMRTEPKEMERIEAIAIEADAVSLQEDDSLAAQQKWK